MKLLIIGEMSNASIERKREYYQQYVDFFTSSAQTVNDDTVVEACLFDDLVIAVGDGTFTIHNSHNGRDLSEYDVFFMRGDKFRTYMDTVATINEYGNLHGIKTINDYSHVRDSSKLLQAVRFERLGIPVARTLLVTSALFHNLPADWEFPCIMKATHGSHGNDNHLVHSIEEAKNIAESTPDKRYVLQRFVPNDGDYRILVIGDEVMVISRTAIEGSHLNNTSKGGSAMIIDTAELPSEIIADAKKLMSDLNMTIAGVDVLIDNQTGEYYFLEVNAQPQLMSGAVVPEKMIMMGKLLDKLNNER